MGKDEAFAIADRYAELIKQHFDLRKLFLFGSYARGENNEFSDIDIAVVVDKIVSLTESEYLLHKLVRKIDLRIEPILFEEDNDPSGFLNEIYKTGILVYSKS